MAIHFFSSFYYLSLIIKDAEVISEAETVAERTEVGKKFKWQKVKIKWEQHGTKWLQQKPKGGYSSLNSILISAMGGTKQHQYRPLRSTLAYINTIHGQRENC